MSPHHIKLAEAETKLAKARAEINALSQSLLLTNEQLKKARAARFAKIPEVKPRYRMTGDRRIMTASDIHGAKMNVRAVAAFLGDVKQIQPDEIYLLGDIIDCGGFLAAHHIWGYVAETTYTYDDDIRAGNQFLDQLRVAAPNARISYVEGNHECLTADHEVLTRRGWIPIANVTKSDEVATLGWGGITEWQRPSATIKKHFTGDLYVANDSPFYRVRMTPGHRIAYYGQYKKDLKYGTAEAVFTNAKSDVSIPVSAIGKRDDLPGITDDDLRLLGWILTDGCINGSFWIYQSKPKGINEIESLLNRIGLKFSHTIRRERKSKPILGVGIKSSLPQHVFRISSEHKKYFSEILGLRAWDYSRKYPKTVPDYVSGLSSRQFSILLAAIISGDGHPTSSLSASIYGSPQFLESLQALCVVNGVRAILRAKTRKGKYSHSVLYTSRASSTRIAQSRVHKESADCDVFCLTTPNSNFFVRHNGSVHVTGNCRVEKWCITTAMRGGNPRDAAGLLERNAPEFLLRLKERDIPYYRMSTFYDDLPVPGTIKRGNLFLTHGSFARSKNAARDIESKLAGNVVFGNTHRSDSYIGRRVNTGVIGAWNPGCLCELQPLWLNTDPTDWTHGEGIQFVSRTNKFLHLNVPIIDGESLFLATLDAKRLP